MAKTIFRVFIGIMLTWVINMFINYTIASFVPLTGWILLLMFGMDLLVDIPLWDMAYKDWNLFVSINLLVIWFAGFVLTTTGVVEMVINWFKDGIHPVAGDCWYLLLMLVVTAGIYLCARFYFFEHKKDPSGLILW